ncbi:MAG: succinate dehydrogenase, cytochrome b556 subunit [Hyphomicrobiales bacterium]|nr:MAG: succinate dehydrogenase, cytochrome b556 subunit [Hyphomicrobiales bacterium]
MAGNEIKIERPLSPHLQIYRPMFTMMMSMMHRITGAALFFGTFILAWWLISAASGPAYYSYVNVFVSSWLGRLILFGYTWALIHHMLGGIRHFIWDTGRMFSRPALEYSAWAMLISSVGLTWVVWIAGYIVMGGRP